MSEDNEDDSVEERLDTVEEQMDKLDFDDVDSRIERIEREQSELRTDLEKLVERIREKDRATPHIDSVEQLYTRLENLEGNIATLRESLEDVLDEPR